MMNVCTDRWRSCGVLIGRPLIAISLIGCLLRLSAMGQEAEVPDNLLEETVEASNVAVVELGGNAEAQATTLKQHFAQTFRPLLSRELDFIRTVCPPAPEQRFKVKAAGESALEQAVEQRVPGNVRAGLQIRLGAQRNSAKAEPTARQRIQQALEEALQEVVSTQDYARYQEEMTKRSTREKRSAILLLVARMDAVLFLTAEQREKICGSLGAKWQEKWQSWLNFDQMPLGYMPMFPDDLIAPYLTKNQKLVWRQQQRVEIDGSDLLEANPDGVQNLDEWWGGTR